MARACQGHGFDPWGGVVGGLNPTGHRVWFPLPCQKKKKKKKESPSRMERLRVEFRVPKGKVW